MALWNIMKKWTKPIRNWSLLFTSLLSILSEIANNKKSKNLFIYTSLQYQIFTRLVDKLILS